jgi:hypothetical protein
MSFLNKKKKMERTVENNMTFQYSQNGVSLKFTIDVSNRQQMQDFKELLAAGNNDINKFLLGEVKK